MTRIRSEGLALVNGTLFFVKSGTHGQLHLCATTKDGKDRIFFSGSETSCNKWLDHLFENYGVADFTKEIRD